MHTWRQTDNPNIFQKHNSSCSSIINFFYPKKVYLVFLLITFVVKFTNSTSFVAFATLNIDFQTNSNKVSRVNYQYHPRIPTSIISSVSTILKPVNSLSDLSFSSKCFPHSNRNFHSRNPTSKCSSKYCTLSFESNSSEEQEFVHKILPWQSFYIMDKLSKNAQTPRRNLMKRKISQRDNNKGKNEFFNARGGASNSVSVESNNNNLQKTFPSFMETYDGYRVHGLKWDEEKGKFSLVDQQIGSKSEYIDDQRKRITSFLKQCFLAENVTPDYFNYTKWRVLQRLVSATVSVFGTRALLLALGVKTEKIGVAATFNWIQKDAFGKFARIMWASKMGRKFDSDAKRWRFRSSLLYASATGLEILTYVFPSFFLLLATSANTLKQISMLTSSATRNSMYKSFAGESQNLGDITAKGEAQIAVVDLLGILLGIFLSKTMGTSTFTMAFAYVALSLIDIFAIYNEVRSVVFNYPNLERSILIIEEFIGVNKDTNEQKGKRNIPLLQIPTPNEISKREKIFFPPEKIDRSIFKTLSQTGVGIEDIENLIPIFKDENYLITWKPKSKINRGRPSICLNPRASDRDIHKALLCVEYIIQIGLQDENKDLYQVIKEAQDKTRRNYDLLQKLMIQKGWNIKHFSFGRILVRTDWN